MGNSLHKVGKRRHEPTGHAVSKPGKSRSTKKPPRTTGKTPDATRKKAEKGARYLKDLKGIMKRPPVRWAALRPDPKTLDETLKRPGVKKCEPGECRMQIPLRIHTEGKFEFNGRPESSSYVVPLELSVHYSMASDDSGSIRFFREKGFVVFSQGSVPDAVALESEDILKEFQKKGLGCSTLRQFIEGKCSRETFTRIMKQAELLLPEGL